MSDAMWRQWNASEHPEVMAALAEAIERAAASGIDESDAVDQALDA
jgi:hypothetical protein